MSRWVDNARIHRAGFRKRVAGLGSTATEMGLIGAVVLVATLAFLFFLGEALQYAFSFVRKDMVAQVSKANGLTPEAFVTQWKGAEPGLGKDILNPVQPTAPVVTAGSNGNEAHAEIYKALQELIDRSLKNGTMTQAQADLLSKLVKEIIISYELQSAFLKAYYAYDDACVGIYMPTWDAAKAYLQAYERSDGSFESAEAAYRSALSVENDFSDAGLDEGYIAMTASLYTDYTKSSRAYYEHSDTILKELYSAADEMGLLGKPEVIDLLNKVSLEEQG